MKQVNEYETLHSHTTESDGKLTHAQVLDTCQEYGIRIVAFTDHDVVIPKHTLASLQQTNHPTQWISGIEISSGLPKEMGGGTTRMLHIVGLFVDPTNNELQNHCQKAQEARIVRMQKIVANLQGLGFDISQEDCLAASGGEAVGRPHIVQALTDKNTNMEIIRSLAQKMLKDSNNNPELKEKYDRMVAEKDEKRYPYTLFLTPESYIQEVYVEYMYWTDLDTSVQLIRNAGGVAILAHWITIVNKLDEGFIDKLFAEGRLDGAETIFGLWTKFEGTWDQTEEYIKTLTQLVNKHKKLSSGGADAHTTEDFQEFSFNSWYADRTIGLTQNIIQNSHVDTRWSSLLK